MVRGAKPAVQPTAIRLVYHFDVPNTRHLRDTLQTEGYPLMYPGAHDGHLPRNWRGRLDDMQVLI